MWPMSGVIRILGVMSRAATDEIKPASAHTSMRMRARFTPVRRAALGFMPTAHGAADAGVAEHAEQQQHHGHRHGEDHQVQLGQHGVADDDGVGGASGGSERGVSPRPLWRTRP